jgi:hypothetical protein
MRAALTRGLDDPETSETMAMTEFIVRSFGSSTLAVVHYGSYAQGAPTRAESARDFFVIVDRYADAYRSLCHPPRVRFSARLGAVLNRILPPNVLSLTTDSNPPLMAKCAVVSLADLTRECSARARDHFAQGRLFQKLKLTWTRDPEARESVRAAIVEARARTFAWGRPFLPEVFDAEDYVRRLLQTSYAAEIRPETPDHVNPLLAAQRDVVIPMYHELLDHLVQRGRLSSDGSSYRDPRPPGALRRLEARGYFAASKVRATLRWIKYMALYDDWLDYVVHKLERRSGVRLELTSLERRWPLIFLWPRALRFLIARRERSR